MSSLIKLTEEDTARLEAIEAQKRLITLALENIAKICDEGLSYWEPILEEVDGSRAYDTINDIVYSKYQGQLITFDDRGDGGLWYQDGEWFYSGY